MSPERLLKHFEKISEAPDAVPRLRRFILDLAVRGKLVEQEPLDEPSVELLKHFEKVDMPFEIPPIWMSAKAGQLLNMQYGKALPASERSVQGNVPVFGSNGVVAYCETALTKEPAIIIGRKGSAGALNICYGPSWTTDVAYFLIPPAYFDIRFLFVALQTLDLGHLGKGVKPGLSRTEAYQLPIAVPPLAEQCQIVAKVNELMMLCDELETVQVKREKRRDRLVAATLAGLAAEHAEHSEVKTSQPFSASSAYTAVPFFLNHLPHLITRPEHIQQLRKTILNLAVRGKLVPQEPKDGSAQELIEVACESKQNILNHWHYRPAKSLLTINNKEIPWQTPERWQWTRIGTFAVVKGGKRLPQGVSFSKQKTPYVYIRVTDMKNQTVSMIDLQYIDDFTHNLLARYIIEENDIYVVIVGSTIGKTGIIPPELHGMHLTENAAKLMFRNIDRKFLLIVLLSDFVQLQFVERTNQVGQPKLALERIESTIVPIAPLAEQRRIAAKVDELMVLCNELEARFTATANDYRHLLEATLQEALSMNPELRERMLWISN